MLQLEIQPSEQYDEEKNEFIYPKSQVLQLEHSLVSVSKWESIWCKPFLTEDKKTNEETISYIECMTITKNVDQNIYNSITDSIIDKINIYIDAKMTSMNFPKSNDHSREIVTSELIYYSMIALNIPFSCEKWHLNRLLALINVCNIKNQPPKKLSKEEIMMRNAELNASRRQSLHSNG
jgi:hypothetical protein